VPKSRLVTQTNNINARPPITGYEPIMDSSGDQIGVYYVGYKK